MKTIKFKFKLNNKKILSFFLIIIFLLIFLFIILIKRNSTKNLDFLSYLKYENIKLQHLSTNNVFFIFLKVLKNFGLICLYWFISILIITLLKIINFFDNFKTISNNNNFKKKLISSLIIFILSLSSALFNIFQELPIILISLYILLKKYDFKKKYIFIIIILSLFIGSISNIFGNYFFEKNKLINVWDYKVVFSVKYIKRVFNPNFSYLKFRWLIYIVLLFLMLSFNLFYLKEKKDNNTKNINYNSSLFDQKINSNPIKNIILFYLIIFITLIFVYKIILYTTGILDINNFYIYLIYLSFVLTIFVVILSFIFYKKHTQFIFKNSKFIKFLISLLYFFILLIYIRYIQKLLVDLQIMRYFNWKLYKWLSKGKSLEPTRKIIRFSNFCYLYYFFSSITYFNISEFINEIPKGRIIAVGNSILYGSGGFNFSIALFSFGLKNLIFPFNILLLLKLKFFNIKLKTYFKKSWVILVTIFIVVWIIISICSLILFLSPVNIFIN